MAHENEANQKNNNQEEEITPELEAKLPFPNAAVVRVMREAVDRDKIISKRVKIEMNRWLAEVCREVSRDLNKTPYAKIEGDDFANAITKYKLFEDLDNQKQRISKSLLRISEDAQALISELEKVEK